MNQDEMLALQVRNLTTRYVFLDIEAYRLADFYAFHLCSAFPCWKRN
jgi:hypothetical protein